MKFPKDSHCKLSKHDGELIKDVSSYRMLIIRLLYLTNSRPYITHSVHYLSQFLNSPRVSHMKATVVILKYLKLAPGQGLFFLASSLIHLRLLLTQIGQAIQMLEDLHLTIIFHWWFTCLLKFEGQKTNSWSSAMAEYRATTYAWVIYALLLLSDLDQYHPIASLFFMITRHEYYTSHQILSSI